MGRRRQNSMDSKRYYDWLDRAGEDMACAGLLLRDDRCYLSCAFHCQQAIEKALKAYLLLKNNQQADGHNLVWLCKTAMRYDSAFQKWMDESAVLNKCYIETRYPTDLPLILEYQQVMDFYNMAKEMFLFICRQLDEYFDLLEEEKKYRKD